MLIAVIIALWIIGAGVIFLLLSFGMGDDPMPDRVIIAALWPVAAIFLLILVTFELLHRDRA